MGSFCDALEARSVLSDALEGWAGWSGYGLGVWGREGMRRRGSGVELGKREDQEAEGLKSDGIYVYLQLMHFVMLQKLPQHCKAIILQLNLYTHTHTPYF